MKLSTAALVLIALVGTPDQSHAQVLFSNGPLPIAGLRSNVWMPAGSGVTYGAYRYSDRVSGASFGTTAATYGYGYHVPRTRLRRALWIFQPQTRTNPQPQDRTTPTQRPTTSSEATTTANIKYDREAEISQALEEAAKWLNKKPPTSPTTQKLRAYILIGDPSPDQASLLLDIKGYCRTNKIPYVEVHDDPESRSGFMRSNPGVISESTKAPALIITGTQDSVKGPPPPFPTKLQDFIDAINKVKGP
jgi:hypothetical protein